MRCWHGKVVGKNELYWVQLQTRSLTSLSLYIYILIRCQRLLLMHKLCQRTRLYLSIKPTPRFMLVQPVCLSRRLCCQSQTKSAFYLWGCVTRSGRACFYLFFAKPRWFSANNRRFGPKRRTLLTESCIAGYAKSWRSTARPAAILNCPRKLTSYVTGWQETSSMKTRSGTEGAVNIGRF